MAPYLTSRTANKFVVEGECPTRLTCLTCPTCPKSHPLKPLC